MPELIVNVEEVTKNYQRGAQVVKVLRALDCRIAAGDFVALIGPSGSGKSTLLNLIAGLDRPTAGRVEVAGSLISGMDEASVTRWRTRHVGFIFQFYHLIPVLSAYENVELPLLLFRMTRARRREQVLRALELVGLLHRMTHRPGQLSGGEQQRVGIARALITDPELVVADEPTGDLDHQTSEEILDLLQAVHESLGKTILLVTHDPAAARRAERVMRMDMGQLIPESKAAVLLWSEAR